MTTIFKFPRLIWLLIFILGLLSIYNDYRMWDKIMIPSFYFVSLFCIVLFVLSLIYSSVDKISKNKGHSVQGLIITYSISVLQMLIFIFLILCDILGINTPSWFRMLFAKLISVAFCISNIVLFLYWISEIVTKKSH